MATQYLWAEEYDYVFNKAVQMTPWVTGVQCEMKEYVTEKEKEREIRIKALGVKHGGCQFERDFKGGNQQLKVLRW